MEEALPVPQANPFNFGIQPKEIHRFRLSHALFRLLGGSTVDEHTSPSIKAKEIKLIGLEQVVSDAQACGQLSKLLQEGLTPRNERQYHQCLAKLETAGKEFQKMATRAIARAASQASSLTRSEARELEAATHIDRMYDVAPTGVAIRRILHPLDRYPELRDMVFKSAIPVIQDRMRADRHTGNGYQVQIRDRVTDTEGNEVDQLLAMVRRMQHEIPMGLPAAFEEQNHWHAVHDGRRGPGPWYPAQVFARNRLRRPPEDPGPHNENA